MTRICTVAGLVFVIIAATAVVVDAARKKPKRLVIEPVSAEQCQTIRDAIATYGVAIVEAGAAARGYTRAQITQARAYCQ